MLTSYWPVCKWRHSSWMLGQEASQPISEAQVPSTWKRTCKALWAFCSKAMGVRQRVPSLATIFSRGLASLPCPRNTCADVSTYASLDAESIPESVHCSADSTLPQLPLQQWALQPNLPGSQFPDLPGRSLRHPKPTSS